MMAPQADVILPAYNALRFIPEAIASIRRQTVQPARIIVVDDGSTDGTADWLEQQTGLIVHRQPNAGAGAARNRAIRMSQAPLLAFLDADDLWEPSYLETQLAALEISPEIDASFVHIEQPGQGTAQTQSVPGFIPSAMAIRRDAFERAGWFPETRGSPDFFVWFLAAKEAGLRYHVQEPALVRRGVHEANSSRGEAMRRQYVVALKQSLDRRRRAQ